MSLFASPRFLPRLLTLDAASCAAMGLAQVAATEWLSAWLQLPQALLLETGLFLIAYAAALAWLVSRPVLPRKAVAVFALGNVAWAIGCIALMAGPWLAPSTLGMVWIGAQAAASLIVADLQWLGLRGQRTSGHMALAA
jgi:hypothetical protein